MTSSEVDGCTVCIKLCQTSPSHGVFSLLASQTTVTSLPSEHLLCVSSNFQSGVSLQQNFMPTLFQIPCLVLLSC